MTKMAMVTLMTKIKSVDQNVSWDPYIEVDDDYDDQNDKDGIDDDDKMIESVDRNVSWDPHVLSCRPPCKGQGEEEGGGAGHDDDEDEEGDEEDDNSDKSGIGDNRSGSSSGEICPPAVLTPLEALTPDQTNVIDCSKPTVCIWKCILS